MLQQGGVDQAVDLPGGVVGGQIGLCDADFFGYPRKVSEVAIAQRMVQQIAGALGTLRRCAHHVDHRQVFGITAGHAVQRAQLPDAEGGEQRRGRFATRIAVGGVGGVQFVGAAYPGDLRMSDDVIEELQVVIPRHAEDVADANLGQTIEQIIGHRVDLSHDHHLSAAEAIIFKYRRCRLIFEQRFPCRAATWRYMPAL